MNESAWIPAEVEDCQKGLFGKCGTSANQLGGVYGGATLGGYPQPEAGPCTPIDEGGRGGAGVRAGENLEVSVEKFR